MIEPILTEAEYEDIKKICEREGSKNLAGSKYKDFLCYLENLDDKRIFIGSFLNTNSTREKSKKYRNYILKLKYPKKIRNSSLGGELYLVRR